VFRVYVGFVLMYFVKMSFLKLVLVCFFGGVSSTVINKSDNEIVSPLRIAQCRSRCLEKVNKK